MPKEPAAFKSQWPEGLQQRQLYTIPCDDDGASGNAWMQVMVGGDGDVYVSVHNSEGAHAPNPFPSIRIRTIAGGGQFTRTRQALLWLADAIRRDRDDHVASFPKNLQ